MLFKRRFVWTFGVLALLGSLAGGVVFGADLKVLPGHVPAPVPHLYPAGRLAATNLLRLAIGVPLRDPAGLDKFLAELYDPASPNYRKYLTPGEFTARFGPTEEDYEAVQEFARASGLAILETHGNRLVLDVAGPAAAVENALHVRLQTYQHPTEARRFFAPDVEPSVAADLPIADIEGLSDFSKPHPLLKKASHAASPKNGSGSEGAFMGDDFRHAYAAGTTLTGAGQMVGLVQFDGFYPSDIAAYAAATGGGRSNITVQTVLLDGYDGTPSWGADGGSTEVSLDIEMAMAMAPGLAKIMVFEAGPNGFQNDILNSMVQNSAVKSLSSSWGWSGGPSTTTDNIFREMAAQGQSYFNASGDSDAFTAGANSVNGVDGASSANAPSSSPYITQVGGTSLAMSGDGTAFASEAVWNWGGGTGSSGGISSYYSIPDWQAGISMTANLGSTTHRNIPDVAMTADNVYVYYNDGSSDFFGGTSCAAPLWAGFMALVNQQAATLGNPSAGFINPAIYAIGKGENASYSYTECFHDVTTGDNFWSGSPASYPAVAGYDLCTGWGTPNGPGLIAALAGSGSATTVSTNTTPGSTNTVTSSNDGLSILPLASFAFTGVVGGPYSPASAAFQLTNDSATPVSWSLVCTSAWLKVQFTNGSVAGNSAASIALNIAPAANTLKPANYATSLAFMDLATHAVQRFPVTLQISQPITLSPATGFAAAGSLGGTFSPGSQVFFLTNLSASPMSWSLVKTSAWLTASATAGSILAGGHSAVTISLASSVKTLPAAVYDATVRFTNSAGLIAAVPCSLSIIPPMVENGGFETGTFAGWTLSGSITRMIVARGNTAYSHTGNYGAALFAATPGYLSQNLATVPGQTYLLSLWLHNATGATPNWFQVQWNGAAIFAQSNLSSTVWTNLQFLVTATTASTALQLGFQDSRAYLGLDDISLAPVATSSVKSIVKRTADFQMVWNTAAGNLYQTQYKTNLDQADWTNLGDALPAAADTLTITDTNAFQSSPQRFYRVLVIPPP